MFDLTHLDKYEILKALAKSREYLVQSARELLHDLHKVIRGEP